MKTVPLRGASTAAQVALVDDEDYDLVMQYRWICAEDDRGEGKRPHGPYAIAKLRVAGARRLSQIRMHKLITGYEQTDHINHNTLDNRRANLRPATSSQNHQNRRSRLGSTSRFKGVHWSRAARAWVAQIQDCGQKRYLGTFASEQAAADAYDAAAEAAYGEYAYLNRDHVNDLSGAA
jgi:hypothetical protein